MTLRKCSSKLCWLNEAAMLCLALLSGTLLALEYTTPLSPEQVAALDTVDLIIALVFLCEFAIQLRRATSARRFFASHWWELFAAIPVTTPLTQALRLLRLLRLLHIAESITD